MAAPGWPRASKAVLTSVCVWWSHARELKWAGESKHQKCTSRRHSRDGETERSLLARDGDPVGGPHRAGLSGIRVDA